MATPEPNPYRQLNYPVNNLEQNFDQTKKIQVRANIGIPTSVNKSGQVLTVGNSTGELEWSTVSGGGDIPSSSSADEGKVLTVDSNGEPQWAPPSGGGDVPSSDPSDEGKVLTVDANGDPSWQEPQGGTQVQSDWTEDDNTDPAYIKHRPKTKVVLVNAATSFSSQRFYWNLTAEQQAKVAGFTNPLVTVQVSLNLNAPLQDDYLMSIMVHGVGDSSWYYYLPNGDLNNPAREILKGIQYIQESSTGCYGYPIDIVMCDFVELTGGSITFPPSPSCTFTLIVEECET